jgi:hypothetical protein
MVEENENRKVQRRRGRAEMVQIGFIGQSLSFIVAQKKIQKILQYAEDA